MRKQIKFALFINEHLLFGEIWTFLLHSLALAVQQRRIIVSSYCSQKFLSTRCEFLCINRNGIAFRDQLFAQLFCLWNAVVHPRFIDRYGWTTARKTWYPSCRYVLKPLGHVIWENFILRNKLVSILPVPLDCFGEKDASQVPSIVPFLFWSCVWTKLLKFWVT